jgi:tetratricopeptide (TPR) repeat protein
MLSPGEYFLLLGSKYFLLLGFIHKHLPMGCCVTRQSSPSRFEDPLPHSGQLMSPLTSAGEQSSLALRSTAVIKSNATTTKEFSEWLTNINPKLLSSSSDYANGKALAAQVKGELARHDVQAFSLECRLSVVESAALLFYTSASTKVPAELWRCIEQRGPLALFEPFMLPLLSGMEKLPRFGGPVFRLRRAPGGRSGDRIFAAPCCATPGEKTLQPERYQEKDFVGERHTLYGPSSCCAKRLSEDQLRFLSALKSTNGRIEHDLLCISSKHARSLGVLRFSTWPADEEEVILPPGWRGIVVGCVSAEWKALLGSVWGVDLSSVHLLEMIDDSDLVPDPDGTCSTSGSFAIKEICELCQAKFERDKSDLGSCRQIVEMYRLASRQDLQLTHLQFWLTQDPGCYDAHVALAELLENKTNSKHRQAAEHYAAALRINPRDPAVHCRLGQLREVYFKDQLAAKAEYEWALRINPNHPDAHAFLGRILEDRGSLAGPKRGPSFMLPADDAKSTLDDDDEHNPLRRAKAHYEAALLVDKDHPLASFLLGRLLWRAVMFESRKLLRKELSLIDKLLSTAVQAEKATADFRFWYGRFLADPRVGRLEDAKFQLQLAVHLDPSHSDAHNALGKLLIDHFPAERNKSRDHMMMALQLNPKSGAAQTNLSSNFEHETLDPVTAKSYYGFMLPAISSPSQAEEVVKPEAKKKRHIGVW